MRKQLVVLLTLLPIVASCAFAPGRQRSVSPGSSKIPALQDANLAALLRDSHANLERLLQDSTTLGSLHRVLADTATLSALFRDLETQQGILQRQLQQLQEQGLLLEQLRRAQQQLDSMLRRE